MCGVGVGEVKYFFYFLPPPSSLLGGGRREGGGKGCETLKAWPASVIVKYFTVSPVLIFLTSTDVPSLARCSSENLRPLSLSRVALLCLRPNAAILIFYRVASLCLRFNHTALCLARVSSLYLIFLRLSKVSALSFQLRPLSLDKVTALWLRPSLANLIFSRLISLRFWPLSFSKVASLSFRPNLINLIFSRVGMFPSSHFSQSSLAMFKP